MAKIKRIPPLAERQRFKGFFPNKVAELDKTDDIEAQPFLMSYQYYNDKECQISQLISNIAIQALIDLRTIGKLDSIHRFYQNGIGSIEINRSGDYRTLYNRLPEDAELKEHKISGVARMFYFIANKIFCLVAIKNTHKEIDKVRRR